MAEKKLHELWIRGPNRKLQKGDLSCPKNIVFENLRDTNYLKCNPQFLSCFFSGGIKNTSSHIRVEYGDKKYFLTGRPKYTSGPQLETRSIYRVVNPNKERAPWGVQRSIVVSLMLMPTEYEWEVLLPLDCHRKILPVGEYFLSKKGKTTKFKIKNKRYWVEKRLTKNRDIIDWIKSSGPKVLRQSVLIDLQDQRKWHLPVKNMKKESMRKFCAWSKGEVLSSKVLDLVSTNQENPQRTFLWSPRASLSLSPCQDFPKKSCYRSVFDYYPGIESDLGVIDLLAGPQMEYVINKKNPEKNIWPSSFYFIHENFHKISNRIEWDEKGYKVRNFQGLNLPNNFKEEFLNISFRCMGVF